MLHLLTCHLFNDFWSIDLYPMLPIMNTQSQTFEMLSNPEPALLTPPTESAQYSLGMTCNDVKPNLTVSTGDSALKDDSQFFGSAKPAARSSTFPGVTEEIPRIQPCMEVDSSPAARSLSTSALTTTSKPRVDNVNSAKGGNSGNVDIKAKLFAAFLKRSPTSNANRKPPGAVVSQKKNRKKETPKPKTSQVPINSLPSPTETCAPSFGGIKKAKAPVKQSKAGKGKSKANDFNNEVSTLPNNGNNGKSAKPEYLSNLMDVLPLSPPLEHTIINSSNPIDNFSNDPWKSAQPTQLIIASFQQHIVSSEQRENASNCNTVCEEKPQVSSTTVNTKGLSLSLHHNTSESTLNKSQDSKSNDFSYFNNGFQREDGLEHFDEQKTSMPEYSDTHPSINTELKSFGFLPCPSMADDDNYNYRSGLEGDGYPSMICRKMDCVCNSYQVVDNTTSNGLESLREGPRNTIRNDRGDESVLSQNPLIQEVQSYLVSLLQSGTENGWKCVDCNSKNDALNSCQSLLASIDPGSYDCDILVPDLQGADDASQHSEELVCDTDSVSGIALRVIKATNEAEQCRVCLSNLRSHAKAYISAHAIYNPNELSHDILSEYISREVSNSFQQTGDSIYANDNHHDVYFAPVQSYYEAQDFEKSVGVGGNVQQSLVPHVKKEETHSRCLEPAHSEASNEEEFSFDMIPSLSSIDGNNENKEPEFKPLDGSVLPIEMTFGSEMDQPYNMMY